MSRMELEIKTAKDRGEVARILIDNGYRCWCETKKKGTGSAKMTVLCVDKPGKDETSVYLDVSVFKEVPKA